MRPDVAKQGEGALGLEGGQGGAEEEGLLLELGAQLSAMVGRPCNSEGEQEGDARIQAASGILVHLVVACRAVVGGGDRGAPQLAAADDCCLLNMQVEQLNVEWLLAEP